MREEGRGVWFFALKSAGFCKRHTRFCSLLLLPLPAARASSSGYRTKRTGYLQTHQEPPRRRRRWVMIHVVMAMKMRVMAPRCAFVGCFGFEQRDDRNATDPQAHSPHVTFVLPVHMRRIGKPHCPFPRAKNPCPTKAASRFGRTMSDEGHRATFAELMSKGGLRPLGE